MPATFTFDSDSFADPSTFRVLSIEGREAISEPFLFAIEIETDDASADESQLIGEKGRLQIRRTRHRSIARYRDSAGVVTTLGP